MRAADEVDGGHGAGLVHRHDGRAVACDSLAAAERLLDGAAECGQHVLDRVVLVDVEIASGDAVEVEAGVEGEQREKVVEEADPGRDVRSAAAVEDERDPERRLGTRADERRLASGGRAGFSAERTQEDVVLGRPPHRHPDPLREPAHDDALLLEPIGEVVLGSDPDEIARTGRRVVARRQRGRSRTRSRSAISGARS